MGTLLLFFSFSPTKLQVKRQFGPRAEFGPKTDSDQILNLDQIYIFGPNLYIRTKFIYSDQIYIFGSRVIWSEFIYLIRIWLWSEFVFWSESVFGPNCRRAETTYKFFWN